MTRAAWWLAATMGGLLFWLELVVIIKAVLVRY